MKYWSIMQNLLNLARKPARYVKHHILWQLRKPFVVRKLRRSPVLPEGQAQEKTILFFAPEAGVTPHFAAMCVLARTLKERGHKVLFVRCFELFERCPVMDMYQHPFDLSSAVKTETCLRCASTSISMLDTYGLEYIDLRRFVTPDLTSIVRQTMQNAPKDLRQFEFDSVSFGNLSCIDLVLSRKISDFDNVEEPIRFAWLKYIESSLLSYLLVDQLCPRFSIDQLIHFNDYALMLGGRLAARKYNIPAYTVTLASHLNVDRRRYVILPTVRKSISYKQARVWLEWRELSLSAESVKGIADDILVRLGAKGSHAYSPSKTFHRDDIRSVLGLSKEKKLLVAYTSSLDEAIAARMSLAGLGLPIQDRQQPFIDQIEWLQALTQYVEASENLQLVVRIHPREGVNRRDSIVSQHLMRLKDAFDRPLQNCRFVWPEEPVSSYDLAESADLVLTSWSTIGSELARLGVPVLTSTNGVSAFPHDDFLEWGETPEAYFQQLEKMLCYTPTFDTVRRAYRWYNLFHLGMSLDLGDIVPSSDFNGLPKFKLPSEAQTIEEIITNGSEILDLNLERLKASQQPESVLEETMALKQQFRRLVHFLFTGQDWSKDFKLIFVASDKTPADFLLHSNLKELPPGTGVLLANDSQTHYLVGKKIYSHYSPMAVRLALLGAHQAYGVSAVNPAILNGIELIENEPQLRRALTT